jgi:RNA recognition motif-containing protein
MRVSPDLVDGLGIGFGIRKCLRRLNEERQRMNIYVGNLSFDTSESQLESAFASYGAVTSARLATDRDTGRARGFGFVEMVNKAEAEAAIAGLNGSQLGGRSLTVNEARPREERPSGNAGGSRNRW